MDTLPKYCKTIAQRFQGQSGYGFAFVQSPPIVLQQMAAITFLP